MVWLLTLERSLEKHCEKIFLDSAPEIRTTAIAPIPLPVANAQIVSSFNSMVQSYELKTLYKG